MAHAKPHVLDTGPMDIERDPFDIVWAAGLFEGEGCFVVAHERKKDRLKVQARLSSSDLDVVERFARIIGFGHVNAKNHRNKPAHWKDMWEWSTQSAPRAAYVAQLFLPHLGVRRSARAHEVIAAAVDYRPHNGQATHCPRGHPYDGHNLQIEKWSDRSVRRCRMCRRADARRWEARKKAGLTAS